MSDNRHVADLYLKLGGADAPRELIGDVLEIMVENSLHLPDVATIVLNDRQLKWVDDSRLAPGVLIEVSARHGRMTESIFDGEIVEIEPQFEAEGLKVTVRAFDRLHRLGRGKHTRTFLNVTDSDVITQLANEAGLQVQIDATTQVHPYLVQWNQTNLEFLRERAAALGYLMYVRRKTLHCTRLPSPGAPVELKWGTDLVAFRPRLSTIDQVNEVTVRGWNPLEKKAVVGKATSASVAPRIGAPETGGKLAQKAFAIKAEDALESAARIQPEAERIARAILAHHESRGVEAEGTAAGNPKIVAGAAVKITNVGTRFSGTYVVTSATHRYDASGYVTDFSVSGMNPATLLSLVQPETPRLNVEGLVIGVVTDTNDPDKRGRVKVKFPTLADQQSDWARVVSVGAGNGRGIEFLPEVNDEVLVGFEQGDVRAAYVIGGLWNGKDQPPKAPAEIVKNGKIEQRVIKSRSGHIITLDDSDSAPSITIEDKSGNVIKLDSKKNELTINVKGDGTISADGNLTIQAKGKVNIKSQQALAIEGSTGLDLKSNANASLQANANLDLKANAAAALQANATLDVKSSAILTIQGTLVKIN
jgi:uncharacterized protein involved in type VI secretion and phage assembly